MEAGLKQELHALHQRADGLMLMKDLWEIERRGDELGSAEFDECIRDAKRGLADFGSALCRAIDVVDTAGGEEAAT